MAEKKAKMNCQPPPARRFNGSPKKGVIHAAPPHSQPPIYKQPET